jgi:hypothetical protein
MNKERKKERKKKREKKFSYTHNLRERNKEDESI